MKAKLPAWNDAQLKTLVIISGLALAIFIIFKLLSKIGLVKTFKQKREDNEEAASVLDIRTSPYFDPTWLSQHPEYQKQGEAMQIKADAIYGSMYFLGMSKYPNVERILSTFGSLQNKGNIGEIAAYYYIDHDRFLASDLLNRLNDEGLNELNKIVNKLN